MTKELFQNSDLNFGKKAVDWIDNCSLGKYGLDAQIRLHPTKHNFLGPHQTSDIGSSLHTEDPPNAALLKGGPHYQGPGKARVGLLRGFRKAF